MAPFFGKFPPLRPDFLVVPRYRCEFIEPDNGARGVLRLNDVFICFFSIPETNINFNLVGGFNPSEKY